MRVIKKTNVAVAGHASLIIEANVAVAGHASLIIEASRTMLDAPLRPILSIHAISQLSRS